MQDERLEHLRVCWYDSKKGYGFSRVESKNEKDIDVFIHRHSLFEFGLERLEPDDELVATVTDNDQGLMIQEIRAVSRPINNCPPSTTTACGEEEHICQLKFFDHKRGYGFIEAIDREGNDTDIFVHISCLNKANIRTLDHGQRLVVKTRQTDRGPVADTIKLLTSN